MSQPLTDSSVEQLLAQAQPEEAEHGAVESDPHASGEIAPVHDAEHGEQYYMPHEPPNLATLIETMVNPHYEIEHGHRPHPSTNIHWGPIVFPINPLFSLFYALIVFWVLRKALGNSKVRRIGRLQNAVEALLTKLHGFFLGIMGPQGAPFIPFLGSLFIFIWLNNIMVLVPFMKSPDSSFKTTIALAIVGFSYARYQNIKASGFKGYFYHLLGSPTDTVTWAMSPLFLLLELIGEVIKPLSLGLRLYGNIFGEDKLLATFLGLGMMIVAALLGTATPLIGVPLHFPFYFLVLLLSTIQATVFSLLTAIYLMLMMPHEHHAEEHETSHVGDGRPAPVIADGGPAAVGMHGA